MLKAAPVHGIIVTPTGGQALAERGEVVGAEIGDAPALAERGHDHIARDLVFVPTPLDQLAGLEAVLFLFQEDVARILDGEGIVAGPWVRPAFGSLFCSRYFVKAPSGSSHGPK
jgi:hypothetical protein